jgi:hypothetical protein
MMERLRFGYDGRLLISHLAAHGLAVALDRSDIEAYVGHDPDSPSFEPVVAFDGGRNAVAAAVRASAEATEMIVEHDIEQGRRGNDRRATIWARASFASDRNRARHVLRLRQELVDAGEHDRTPFASGLLASLGAPATWGTHRSKPSDGATALDGVLGNHTSDLVRGVLRPARRAAAEIPCDAFSEPSVAPAGGQLDKTGWAPPGTEVDLVHQWLAVLGLSLLPVAHRPFSRSVTPACWATDTRPRRYGVTLPLLDRPVSLSRLRALLSLASLTAITDDDARKGRRSRAAGELRSLGVADVVVFSRRYLRGSGSSVGFTYARGERVGLRQP